MKKNILIISPALSKGGMERQLSIFLQSFDRKKYNVTLALLRNRIEYEIPNDIEIIQFNKKGKIDLKFYWRLFKILNQSKWDVINSKISGLNEQIMFLCGLLGKDNLIIEIRNSGKRLYKTYKQMDFLYKIFNKYNKWRIVTNSKKAKKELTSFLSKKVNIEVIYNAIDTDRFRNIPIDKKENKYILGFVGRIQPVKNIEILLKTMKNLDKNIILEIYGNKENMKYYSNLLNLIDKYDLKERVTFFDTVDDVEKIYNRFDIFILPSNHEGTPNVLLEAMACECICLVSKGANSDNYLDKRFVFDTNNDIELANKIKMIYNMSEYEKKEIKKYNRQYIMNNFTIENMIKKYEGIYKCVE